MASIRKNHGRWQAIIRRKQPDGRVVTKSKMFPKKVLAVEWGNKMEVELSKKLYINSAASETSVQAILERYREEITPRKRSAQIEAYRIKTVIKHLGHLTLEELSPAIIIDFVDERLEDVVADSIRKELNVLSLAVDAGMALWGIELPANPVKTAKDVLKVTKTLRAGNKRERRPTSSELECLYRTLPNSMALLVEFAVESGMRRGEIVGMKVAHRDGNILRIPKTKTETPRTIPLSTRACKILDEVGEFPYVESSITHMFQRACKKCAIVDLRFHDLRHEAASRFFERGMNVAEVAAITGQSFAVLQRYTHIKPSHIAQKMG